MNTLDAILSRRSIRKFLNKDIPMEIMEKILTAAIQAPSAKNQQPWKFIVVTEANKAGMLKAMRDGIENTKERLRDFPNIDLLLSGAAYSAKIMEQAPVTVFVMNPIDEHPWTESSRESWLFASTNTQSIGAAIENMLLAGESLGIGSLWICDVFFAYEELCHWLGEDSQLVAAVSFGYADESPNARPRKPLGSVVEWR